MADDESPRTIYQNITVDLGNFSSSPANISLWPGTQLNAIVPAHGTVSKVFGLTLTETDHMRGILKKMLVW